MHRNSIRGCRRWSLLELVTAARPRRSSLVVTFVFAMAFVPLGSAAVGGVKAAAKQSNKTLTMALSHDPSSLDPMVDSSGETQNFLHNIFDSLVVANDKLHLTGDLAKSWKFVPPSSWDFKLRPGVKFQNGMKVTAQDVAYSFNRILDPKNNSPMLSFITPITAASVVNRTTVRIKTSTPSPIVPEITKEVMIVPRRVVQSMGESAFGQHPVGSGPYKVVSRVPNDHTALQAFNGYWAGPAPIRNIVLRPIPDDSTRVAALRSGQVDIISNFGTSFVSTLQHTPGIKLFNEGQSRTAEIILDTNPADGFKPFQDVRVRQAVTEAIDYRGLTSQVMSGLAIRNCQPVTTIIFGHIPGYKCPQYNPAHAKSLLAAAGYPNGFDVNFGGTNGESPGDLETEQAIVGMLSQVGIRVHLQVEEFGTWLNDYHHRKWPMVFHTNGTTVLDADPDIFQLFYASTGRNYFSSPSMDQAIAASEHVFVAKKRLPLLQNILKTAMANYVWVSLYNEPDLWAMKSSLRFQPRPDEWTVMTRAKWKG
jgi:peptide/nickel transport system substrate-binding protein